jgi:hypothetical protein
MNGASAWIRCWSTIRASYSDLSESGAVLRLRKGLPGSVAVLAPSEDGDFGRWSFGAAARQVEIQGIKQRAQDLPDWLEEPERALDNRRPSRRRHQEAPGCHLR